MGDVKRMRADELLLERGLVESRTQGQRLIMAGEVFFGDMNRVEKSAQMLPVSVKITIRERRKYVSRGGDKLEGFFSNYLFPIEGKTVLDVGASTGGFTDFLLQNGASEALCLDVGRGQLHCKLRSDPRVINWERCNARSLDVTALPRRSYDIIVMDLSFISLEKVVPAVWPVLAPDGLLVALIKPQFEAEKREVDRGRGIIVDEAIHRRVRERIGQFFRRTFSDANVVCECNSPISGTDGNREFFIGVRRSDGGTC